MKEFFKHVLAVVVGLLIVGAFTGIMSFVMLFSMLAATQTTPEIRPGTVLRIDLSGTLSERATSSALSDFFGTSATDSQGLDDIRRAIKVAAANDNVVGIYIESGILSSDHATLEELRKELTDFKQTGKFILAYGDSYMQGAYYVASVADSLLVNPSGMIDWHGISAQMTFYSELLDKVGVKMQTFRVGTYKSYVEPYTRTSMSDANRQQLRSMISDIWTVETKDVAASRHLSVDTLNHIADGYCALASPDDYVKKGLADRLAYIDEARDILHRLAGTDDVHLLSPQEMALCDNSRASSSEGEIAVYYATGSIVGSATEGLLGSGEQIVGPDVVSDLDALEKDDDVKAVVLRVNSGGGSAYASEQIWHAICKLREKKPVVVSMNGAAASGGYYISCGADCIVAEPTTLTGSIGIFGMIPDATGLLVDKLGLHFDVVKTNETSDFGAMGRAFSPAESAAMQAYVERGYQLFLQRVAAGRKMTVEQVDSIAQGRVWTGRQALSLGLVDRLGTLDDAISEAARRAKLTDYALESYPAPAPWYDDFLEKQKSEYMESKLQRILGTYYRPLLFLSTLNGTDCLQARVPFVLELN